MAEMTGGSRADGDAHRNDDGRHVALEPKHKIFLSHSGAPKPFVENLCHELERCHRYPFFDLLEECQPIGENFPSHTFRAIKQCNVGVVILSEEFLTTEWPMMELVAMVEEAKKRDDFKVIPVFLRILLADLESPENRMSLPESQQYCQQQKPSNSRQHCEQSSLITGQCKWCIAQMNSKFMDDHYMASKNCILQTYVS